MAPSKKSTRTWLITIALTGAAVAMSIAAVAAIHSATIPFYSRNGDGTSSVSHMTHQPYVVGAVFLAITAIVTLAQAVWVWLERTWNLAQHAVAAAGIILLIAALALVLSRPPVF
jgi:uncharacterized membrane protein YidH (DUF202 family)